MPYDDMREFMELLLEHGELKTVEREVDSVYELATVAKKSLELHGPALLFQRVKGFDAPVVTGVCGTMDRVFKVFETTPQDFPDKYFKAYHNPIPPELVDTGPCKEVVQVGEEVDLTRIPILWHSKGDAGRYLTATNIIVKDPDTGIRNNSIHRAMVVDKKRLAIWENFFHLWEVIRKYWDSGRPCPVAIAVGTDPATFCCAGVKIPYHMDELAFAGGMRGEAVRMVKCETVDLDVPATSELVIEGEIVPERVTEAPFGEYSGYYGQQRQSPLINVKAITHRRDYIYEGLVIGLPPHESQAIHSVITMAPVYHAVSSYIPRERIRGVCMTEASSAHSAVISIDKRHPGEAKVVLAAVMPLVSIKNVVVVDKDVDPYSPTEVDWAITWRSRPEDWVTIEMSASPLDPNTRNGRLAAKIGIDATEPIGGDKIMNEEVIKWGVCRFPTKDLKLEDYIEA